MPAGVPGRGFPPARGFGIAGRRGDLAPDDLPHIRRAFQTNCKLPVRLLGSLQALAAANYLHLVDEVARVCNRAGLANTGSQPLLPAREPRYSPIPEDYAGPAGSTSTARSL